MVLRLKNPPMGINDLPADPTDNQPRSSDIRVIDTSASPLTDQHLLPLPQDQPPSPTATTTTAPAPAPAPVAAGWLPWLSHELSVGGAELWEILQIKAFVFCTLGQAASAFASGGLAEWLPVYLIRYAGADVSSAGLLVGAATIVGGLGGTILGAKVSEHYLRKVKSAYFLIPALFTLPAALLFVITLNAPHLGTGGIGVLVIAVQVIPRSPPPLSHHSLSPLSLSLVIAVQIFFWTGIAPISTVSMNVVPPRLRARSCGVLILVQHVLGDLISPPLIGAISDSLQVRLAPWMDHACVRLAPHHPSFFHSRCKQPCRWCGSPSWSRAHGSSPATTSCALWTWICARATARWCPVTRTSSQTPLRGGRRWRVTDSTRRPTRGRRRWPRRGGRRTRRSRRRPRRIQKRREGRARNEGTHAIPCSSLKGSTAPRSSLLNPQSAVSVDVGQPRRGQRQARSGAGARARAGAACGGQRPGGEQQGHLPRHFLRPRGRGLGRGRGGERAHTPHRAGVMTCVVCCV